MKKRVFSILTALCLCLTLLPVAAFATEDSGAAPAEEPQQEQQEKVKPKADSEQPEDQLEAQSAPQPTLSGGELVVLNDEGETVIELTKINISNYMSNGLTDGSYQLGDDVTIKSGSLEVKGTVTLDLNGHTLRFEEPEQYYAPKQVNAGIRVYNSDSSESTAKYALTLCDTSTAKTGTLDVWGKSMEKSGEGLFVGQNGELTMTGGTITDSSGTNPWGIGIGIIEGKVTMTGGKIENQTRCGITLAGGTFEMSGDAVISNCGSSNSGGGIWIGGGTFTMTGGTIENCKATKGGGVYVGVGTFTMTGGSIENCKAMTTDSSTMAFGGGIYNEGRTTLSGEAKILNCQAANAGGGIYDYSVLNICDNVEITGCTAPLWSAMIVSGTISGGTFNGTVTNNGTITGGTFTGEVSNVGTITGGIFNDKVTNHGTITGGTFTGGIIGVAAHATGSGTKDDPYQISTAIGLEWLRDKVNDAKTEEETKICAVLTKDIALDSSEAWTPIGYASDYDETKTYSGTFDGQGHTISGLTVDATVSGLFGYTKNAAIKNLIVAGSVGGGGCTTAGGGIVGYAVGGTIENCGNLCEVTVPGSRPGGGIVGSASSLTITGCYNAGRVFKGDGSSGGGIVGVGKNVKIYDCYNVGNVESYSGKRGGIVGETSGSVFVYNCYNAGNVIKAESSNDDDKTVRGIVGGGDGTVQIQNCYYLEGTKADTEVTAKSAAEFTDGTVLKLLKKGERGNNADPWAAECQYVDVASLTLPVFKNQNTHTHNDPLTHVLAKDPTTSEVGNIEYWYCPVCGKYFSDADGDHEITQADTVIPKRQSSGSGSSSYPITVPDKVENGSVTISPKNASKGSAVTITVTPDSGYVLETITVTDKNGNDLRLTDKGNGKYTFTMPGSKVGVKVTFMEDNSVLNFFYDVPNDAYYYEAVKWAAESGVTGGVGNSLFAPDQPCTRAQIVTFLWRAAGSPVVNYLMPFTDVDEGAYYAEAVRWAASTGIVTGLTETTFGTNDVCTRAQAAAMIYRYAQAQGKGFTGAWMFLLPFTDVPEWAYESVAWCYMNGVTTGVSETTFAPGNDCTRAQIVTFLWRAFSK